MEKGGLPEEGVVAEGLRPKIEDEEGGTARRRGRGRGGPRGIPSQGLPKPPPKPPQQQPPPKPPEPAPPAEPSESVRGVLVEDDGRKVESFIEQEEEQRKNGGPKAQYKLAKRFLEPESRDLTLAYHFMKLAAERVPEAMMQLYDLFSRGEIGDPLG